MHYYLCILNSVSFWTYISVKTATAAVSSNLRQNRINTRYVCLHVKNNYNNNLNILIIQYMYVGLISWL